MGLDNVTKKDVEQAHKLTEVYEQVLTQIKERREKFKQEFSKTMQDFVGEQKTALEQIIEVVDGGGKQKENQNALERFLFGENSEQIFQKQLKAYETYMESAEAIKERYADDAEKQKAALYLLKENKKGRMGIKNSSEDDEASSGFVGEMVEGMSDELSDGLTKMLTDFENFEANFKNLGKNLANEMIKISADALMQLIFNEENTARAIQAIRASYGAVKAVGRGIMGFFKGGWAGAAAGVAGAAISSHHSGGVIPEGANVNLPGTDEQLALLKGGERILSPGENVQYDRNSSGSNVVFNNFNIKAWDSKDVQKYLLENKQLLNAITYEGIKDNNQRLRQIVRNA